MGADEHAVIGTVAAGYANCKKIEHMAEYVLKDPQKQALPVAYITFSTGRGGSAWLE